jgi:hypothetical protein
MYPFNTVQPGTSNITLNLSGILSIISQNGSSAEWSLLGETTKEKIEEILDGIVAITIPSPLGPLGPPANSATFTAIKALLFEILSIGVKNN